MDNIEEVTEKEAEPAAKRITSPSQDNNTNDKTYKENKEIIKNEKAKIGLSPITVDHVRHFTDEDFKHLIEIEHLSYWKLA